MRLFKTTTAVRVIISIVLVTGTTALVWALRNNTAAIKMQQDQKENWTKLEIDPWEELSNIIGNMQTAMPFVQHGKALLKNTSDSLVETKEFRVACFDSLTMTYQLEQLEMLQTKNWQAVIDHERSLVAVNPVVQNKAAAQMGFDIRSLKQIFETNKYSFEVFQDEHGKRMLHSKDFTNGALSGLQIRYEASTHNLRSVTMGIPKVVATTEEEDKKDPGHQSLGVNVVSESLELQYEEMQPAASVAAVSDPNTYFKVKNKKLTVVDKKFDAYRIINNFK